MIEPVPKLNFKGREGMYALASSCLTNLVHALLPQDVAIAYGYNRIMWTLPQTVTIGSELPLNQIVEMLRLECAMAGFTEVLTWALCSHEENFNKLQRKDDGATAVSIGNPATAEFEVCRTSLLPGVPKAL